MTATLYLVGIILCALASFAGAFFGVRTSSDAKPLKIPIYTAMKESRQQEEEKAEEVDNKRIQDEWLFGVKHGQNDEG